MIGRREFGVVGMSAAALGAMQAVGVAQEKAGHDHGEHGSMFDDCAKACNDCQRACDGCVRHCAIEMSKGNKEHLKTLSSCSDCAAVCATAAQIVARHGYFAKGICESCADICGKCAKECEQFSDDKHMQECAKECRKCEKACREMVKHA